MFGNDNQNPDTGAMSTNDPSTADMSATNNTLPVNAVAPSSASPADTPSESISAEPDAVASAPSAPTIPDPMVTPSVQPSGINDAPAQSAYTELAAQISPAKPNDPNDVSIADPMTIASSDLATVDPDLAQIKLRALQSLEPLVGQLDQTPDEKFKTVMMLIQASDNSKMLTSAYEAASQITDEKTRAQALLDVVNEINYFTAQAQNKQQ